MTTYSELVARVELLELENLRLKRAGFDVVHESYEKVARISEELLALVERLKDVRDDYLESAEFLADMEAEERSEKLHDHAHEVEDLALKLKARAYRMAARW